MRAGGIREKITDCSKGDDLRRFWALFRRRERAKSKFAAYVLTFLCNRSARRHGGYVGNGAKIAGIPCLPHGLHGVYISRYASIGAGCRIYQNVTIGEVDRRAPRIGDGCLIGAGAVVVGGIRIGDRVKIGAGTVVSSDIPDGCTVVSQPPRVLGRREKPAGNDPPFRRGRAWIELDRDALRQNVGTLRKRLPPGCELMPAVKADAYGHGAVLISRELERLGVGAFCVATAAEGAGLRENGIRGDILVLGYTHPKQFPLLVRCDLIQTVVDRPYAELLNGYGKKIRAHIAVDTGMHRLGERCENIDGICGMFRLCNLKIEGIYTHLCADDTASPEDKAFTLAQGQAFQRVLSQLKARGCGRPKAHLLASYGLVNYPELGGDYARVGIALYGMLGTRTDTGHCALPLRPVLSLKARVASVKTLRKGEAAGYGLQFVAPEDCRIAVLSIGYADGLPRALSCGVGKALIGGRDAPVAGRVCMDQTLVDVSGIPDVKAGDTAVLIGRSGGLEITACDLAEQAGTISNEILSRLGARLDREMTDGGPG